MPKAKEIIHQACGCTTTHDCPEAKRLMETWITVANEAMTAYGLTWITDSILQEKTKTAYQAYKEHRRAIIEESEDERKKYKRSKF